MNWNEMMRRLRGYFLRRDLQWDDAEEQAQRARIRFHTRYGNARPELEAEPLPEETERLLYTIARNLFRDWLRRLARRREVPLEDRHSVATRREDLVDACGPCWDRLTVAEKQVILLRGEGYSHVEIAERTGLSLAAVRTYLYRGLRRLRECVAEQNLTS